MPQDRASRKTGPPVDDALYRAVFDSMDQAAAICDIIRGPDGRPIDFRLLEVNAAAETLTGRPRATLLGQPAAALVADEDVGEWLDLFGRVVETGKPARVERHIVCSSRWFMVMASPHVGDRFTLIVDDITARKRAEQTQRESEERKAFLLALSDVLRPLFKPEEIQATINRMVADHLKVDRVHYVEIERQFGVDQCVVRRGRSARLRPDFLGRHPISLFPVSSRVLGTGRTVVMDDVATESSIGAIERSSLLERQIGSLVVVPLIKEGQLVAALPVQQATPRIWQPAEIRLIEDIAERSWEAVERARAEEALRRNEERLQHIARASHDIHWELDLATNKVDWSEGLQAELGFSAGEIGSEAAWFFGRIHPEERDRIVAKLMDSLAGGRSNCGSEFRFHRADGTYAHVASRCFILRDDEGRAVRVIGALQDVTDRYRAELALRDSEERHRALIEGIPQLVWRAVDAGHWTWLSPQWAAYTGLSEAESLGTGWLRAVHPDDRKPTLAKWAEAQHSGSYETEYRIFRRSEGRYRWFQTRGLAVRDENGAILEWLGTSTDIDELRGLQERQSVLVAELQHRTRNLITVVRGISEQTMSSSASLDEFRAQFNGRLQALSRVQGLLSQSEHAPITIGALLHLELDAMSAGRADNRIQLAGPEITLPSSAVQTLALAIHELATNAGKYGAFAAREGHLEVLWGTYVCREGVNRLALTWRESGVSLRHVEQQQGSTHRGYGRQLIEQALPYSLKARTTFELRADGARCTIDLPVRARHMHA